MRTATHAVLIAAAVALTAPAWAQSVPPQTPAPTAPTAPAPLSQSPATPSGTLSRVDAATVAGGQRSSEVVGSDVVNEANETVGKVDDLIVTSNERAPVAVLSVGGFLGIGTRYVLVPYSAIEKRDDRLVLRGATKDSLKALPEYKYRG